MSQEKKDRNFPEILAGKYAIQRQLASKGGRKTFLARDLNNDELVVIKVLAFSNDLTWEDLKLFEREAETLKSIELDSIPRYIDYFELEQEDYKGFALVQTYIEAPSLEEQLQSGRGFSEAEVKELATAVLQILDYLHSRQPSIVHRDLKPSNLLLSNRTGNSLGNIYLVDFGSVQNLANKKGGTITVVGTYGYMPPEQFGGRAQPASDLYSLGATLIYLVTGQHPADLPENDLKIEFEQLVNLSPGLTNWLKKMIEPSLSRRFTSAKDALRELEKCHLYSQNYFQQKQKQQQNINQPANSKVILQKNARTLIIKIPPVGLFSVTTYGNIFLLAMLALFIPILPWSFIIDSRDYTSHEYENIAYFIWVLKLIVNTFMAVIISAISFVLIKFLIGVFGSIIIKINSQKVFMVYKLFGIKRHSPMPSPKKDIYRLEKIEQSRKYKSEHYLKLWTKKHNYEIGRSHYFSLTNLEINWLAQELSNWLNIPVIENDSNE